MGCHTSFGLNWDHPRSRGVYINVEAWAAAFNRIIPARAGFTR